MQALLPIFLLIALGLLLRQINFPNPSFWPTATQATYYIFLPALLVSKISATAFSGQETLWITTAILATVGLVTLLILAANRWLGYSGPVITSVLQGGIRTNTYVGLATAAALFGTEGLAVAGLVHGIWVLTVNTICVGALVVYCGGTSGSSQPRNLGGTLLRSATAMAKNPMILACLVGLGLSAGNISTPTWIGALLAILGQAALPLGLLLVGAGLRLDSLALLGRPLLMSSAFKLVVMPLTIWWIIGFLPIAGVVASVLVLVASLPSAASSYVLAQEMGGDAELMAGILTAETALAALTMPLIVGII